LLDAISHVESSRGRYDVDLRRCSNADCSNSLTDGPPSKPWGTPRSGRVRGGRGLLGVLTASSRVRYRPRPHARTRSFLMARSGPGGAARIPVVRRLRAAIRSRFASDAHPARRCATATMRTWEIRRRTLTIASVDAGHIPNGVTGDERCGPCPTWERRRHRGEFRGAIEPAALTHFCSGISPDYTASSGLRWRIVKEGLR